MDQRVAIVTGGFGALGRVVARQALAAGYAVAAVDFAANPPAELASEVMAIGSVNLADAKQAQDAVAAVAARFGRIDAVFNIAGGFSWQTVQDGDAATWDRLHGLNLVTALNMSKAALPQLLAGGAGRIVNVGANAALRAATGMGAYAASKAGVHRLTEAMAEELKGRGVTVNAVLPSIIDTPANRADMPDSDFAKWVTPQDLAAVMLFLASPAAGAITGALIPVTGGL
ncbi:MAG TPA: SDR family NAD(P)-dependent oxidoreductase [Caulobacteraceae bacterium]